MSNEEIEEYLARLDDEVLLFKQRLFKLSWYMRGGVSSHDLFHTYTFDDFNILDNIVKENIETTKKVNLPLL